MVEAIVEDEDAKTELFRTLDQVVTDPDAILASNTSSIPIMKLGVVTKRPQHVIGIHFFNPVPVLQLVELVPSLLTAAETTERARDFVEGVLGKQAIDCQDRAGFVVNALLIPFVLSAIRMLESGFATAEDIDRGLVLGAAHPQGPLALADLIGLDTTKAVAESLYEEFKEPLYAAPPLLAGWSTPACSGARRAAASTPTPDEGRHQAPGAAPARGRRLAHRSTSQVFVRTSRTRASRSPRDSRSSRRAVASSRDVHTSRPSSWFSSPVTST